MDLPALSTSTASDHVIVGPAPQGSMRGPYLGSLALHGGVALALLAGVALTATVVAKREETFLAQVAKKEEADKAKAKKEEANAVVEAAKTQVALSVTDLVAGHLAPPDSDRILADAQSAVEDLFAQQAGDFATDGMIDPHLMEQAEQVALERALASADEQLKRALVAQVQQKIRSEVVPEIAERVERELKQRFGEELKNKVAQAVRDDKRERLAQLAQTLREGAKKLNEAAAAGDLRAQREAAAAAEEQMKPALAQATAQDPLLDAKQKAAAEDRAPGEALAQAADPAQGKKALSQRAVAVENLAKALETHAGRGEFDDVQRRIAAKAREQLADPLAKEVRTQIEAQTIPVAAEKLTAAVAKDLERLGLPKDEFQKAVAGDIRQGIDEAAKAPDAAPTTEVAWMKSDRALNFRQTSDLAKARADLDQAATQLTALAKEQAAANPEDATAQRALAKRIASAETAARSVLSAARTQSLQADDRIEASLNQLRRSKAQEHALGAAEMMDKRLAEPTAKEVQATVKDLADTAQKINEAGEALAREQAARPSPTPSSASELAAQADAAGTEQSAGKVAQQAGKDMAAAAAQAVGKATEGLVASGVLERDEHVNQLLELRQKLADALHQSTDPRAMGASQIAAGMGSGLVAGLQPGNGRGPGSGPGYGQGGPWVRPSAWNRELYEKFVKDLRERTNPSSAQGAPGEPEGIDTVADPALVPEPAIIYVPAAQDKAKDEAKDKPAAADATAAAAKREPPKPTFSSPAAGYAPFAAKPLTIDGDLGDWGELTYPLTMKWSHDNKEISDGPQAWLRWSNDGLYIAYATPDPNGIQRNDWPWSGDCIEMWCDTSNSRAERMAQAPTSQQFCFIPFGMEKDPTLSFCEILHIKGTNDKHVYDTEHRRAVVAAKQIPGGYQVEAFLRKQTLSRPVLLPGMWLAMNFSVNTGLQGRNGREVQWSASKGIWTFDRPNTWGDVLLLGADAAVKVLSRPMEGEPAPIDHLVVGQSFTIEIADADLNLDPARADRIAATVDVSDHGEPVLVVLKETGPDTGVFRCSLGTRAREDEPAPNAVRVRPGETIKVTYQDVRAACGETDRVVTAELPVAIPVMRFGKQ